MTHAVLVKTLMKKTRTGMESLCQQLTGSTIRVSLRGGEMDLNASSSSGLMLLLSSSSALVEVKSILLKTLLTVCLKDSKLSSTILASLVRPNLSFLPKAVTNSQSESNAFPTSLMASLSLLRSDISICLSGSSLLLQEEHPLQLVSAMRSKA